MFEQLLLLCRAQILKSNNKCFLRECLLAFSSNDVISNPTGLLALDKYVSGRFPKY